MVNVVVKNLNKPANNNCPSKWLHPTCYNTRKYVINVSYCFSSLSDILSLTKKEIDVWGKKKLKEEIDKYNDLRIRAKSHDNRRELADKLWRLICMKKDEMAIRKELSEKRERLKERLSAIPGTLYFLHTHAYSNSKDNSN